MKYSDILLNYLPPPEPPMGGGEESFDRAGFLEATRGFIAEVRRRINLYVLLIVLVTVTLLILAYNLKYDATIVAAIIGGNGLVAGVLVARIMDLEKQRLMALWMERIIPFADDDTIQKIIENTVRVPVS